MSPNLFYCSELSRQSGEQTYGTASVGGVWLLLEYPYEWRPHALEGSALSPEVKTCLTTILKTVAHSRLLFVKQQRARSGETSLFVVNAREREPFVVRFGLSSYEQLLKVNVRDVARARTLDGGSPTDEPLFLVCTHGRRDKCCAKFGYPLYKALQPRAGQRLWQSSHVGGDRFAANLVCFPEGLFYAHVTEESARAILDEYDARRLVLEKYRGRACYSYPVQAAEFFVRRRTGLRGLDELRGRSYERLGERSWRVTFLAPGGGRVHEARVSSRQSEFQNYVTCHATEEHTVVQFSLDDYRESEAPAEECAAPRVNDC